jgi:hypothetical protein
MLSPKPCSLLSHICLMAFALFVPSILNVFWEGRFPEVLVREILTVDPLRIYHKVSAGRIAQNSSVKPDLASHSAVGDNTDD